MVSELSHNYNTHFCCFYIDTEGELDQLPAHDVEGKGVLKSIKTCAYGSRATCANGKTYILNGKNKWVVFKGSSGTSSGTTPPSGDAEEDIEPIPNDDINGLFNK